MAQISVEQLEKEYECEYCTDPFRDPRILPCAHTYRRSCLDEMVEFNNGGAATIVCPNRCPQVNNIGKDQTTQIFPRNFALSKIMTKINESTASKKNCESFGIDCKAGITKWCVACKKTFCNSCFNNHECWKKFGVYGKFNEYSECFEAYCKEHDACAKYVCFDCNNQFLCNYCLHRQHVKHTTGDLRKTAFKMKEDCIRSLEDAEDQFRKTSFVTYEKALYDIDEFKNNLNYELNKRIVLKLEIVKREMEKEKARIMNEVQIETDKYKQQIGFQGLCNKPIQKAIEKMKDTIEKKNDYEIIIEQKQSQFMTKLQCIEINLTDVTNDLPLGNLCSKQFEIDLSFKEQLEVFKSNVKNETKYFDDVTAKADSFHSFLKGLLTDMNKNIGKVKQEEISKIHSRTDSNVSPRSQVNNAGFQQLATAKNNEFLQVGSLVQVNVNKPKPIYGVLRWIGTDRNYPNTLMAGIELLERMPTRVDGAFCGTRYFTTEEGRGFFCKLEHCEPDERFQI